MHGRVGGWALVALVAMGVGAGTAQAANPMAGQLYEGPGPRGGSSVHLQVSPSGTRVQYLNFGFERGCRRNGRRLRQPAGSIGLRKVRIRNGRFSWRRSIRYPQTGGWLKTTVTGRFVDGGARFVGTVRERMRNPQTRARCDSRTVRISAAVAERVLVNGSWAGATGQGRPVTLTITDDGVTAMAVEVTLTCRNGEQIVRALAPPSEPAAIFSDLTFRLASWTADARVAVQGTARRGLVSGTVNATDSIERPDGEDTRTHSCASGDVPFEARPTPGGR